MPEPSSLQLAEGGRCSAALAACACVLVARPMWAVGSGGPARVWARKLAGRRGAGGRTGWEQLSLGVVVVSWMAIRMERAELVDSWRRADEWTGEDTERGQIA